MRRLFIVSFVLTVSISAHLAGSADAVTIEGRVVDSAGKPVAGAEVRIWQHVRGPDGSFTERSLEFDGGDALLTDAVGRFVSPDMLVSDAFAVVVAEARGMLAGRSHWIPIAQDAVAAEAPDITLKRLRVVIGRVLDRRGQPVDGARVFNSGDGQKRVEARSKSGGKFLLAEVPEGGVFLFAEKPGYRFTGVRLPPDEAKATLVLTSVDEPGEPKATLPPLLSPEEEYALAREVLDPWLEQLAKTGTPQQRIEGFNCLIQINGLEALQRLDGLVDLGKGMRDHYRDSAIRSVISHRNRPSWEEVRAMIEASDDEYCKAADLIYAAFKMDDGDIDDEQAMRREWLTSAAAHARKVEDPTKRVGLLAGVAERLFNLGEVARARQILAEAENDAKPLVPDYPAQLAFFRLSLAAAHDDADRAIDWFVKSGEYLHGGRVAVGLLPDRPQRAVEVWQRVAEGLRKNPLRTGNGTEYRAAAEFCYRLARVDRPLAEQVAADANEAVQRYRATAGVLLALAETQPAEARTLLAALVRDELPQLPIVESRRLAYMSAPAIAAWLLPVAEQAAPDLCGELFWRSLALRLPRPGRGDLNNQVEETDVELAKLLSRYDREIARALLEPLAGIASASGNAPVQTTSVRGVARIVSAAVHVDPRWAKRLLDTVVHSPSSSAISQRLRSTFILTLALPLPDRWNAEESCAAGFWEPSAKDRGFPP